MRERGGGGSVGWWRRNAALVAVLAFLWVVYVLLALSYFPPPSTVLGWALFLVVAPVGLVLAEGLAEHLAELALRSPPGRWVAERTEGKRFSWLRVGSVLALVALLTGVLVGGWQLFS